MAHIMLNSYVKIAIIHTLNGPLNMKQKSTKRLTKKEQETKNLKKRWRDLGYNKYMPFGNFRILASKRKT